MHKKQMFATILAGVICLLAGCGIDEGKALEEISVGNQVMDVSVHDPSIVKADGKYYIFGTHMSGAVSDDLQSFMGIANGVNDANPLFDDSFWEDMGAFDFVGMHVDGYYAVWAPDVIYNSIMGKWIMYFSTSHDYCTSTICMATSDSVEGPYHYQETLLYSGYDMLNVDQTNFYEVLGEDASAADYMSVGKYNNLNFPNCIDPTAFYDEEGNMWMVYGSWSGGIWLLELNRETGLPIHPQDDEDKHIDTYYGYYLLGGLHNSCEGPYILYDDESGYYYLFVSYGGLEREGGYQIRQYRSCNVTGPYVDECGNTLGYTKNHSEYGLKMMGNYMFPSLETAYMAPGHCSVLKDDDGKYYLFYHQRFNNGSEYHEPRVHQMFMNEDNWLVAAPFATGGEALSEKGYKTKRQISGQYYCVNHGTDISADIHTASQMRLEEDGSVQMEDGTKGSWTLKKGTNFVTISMDNAVYKGVIVEMNDEAGNAVRCITAASNNNESIWAVFYQE